MKFLIDAQLPPVLARVMKREGYEVAHVFELEMVSADDIDIKEYALKNDSVIISKDEDFATYAMDPESKVNVIWVRTGNCKNNTLISAIIRNLEAAKELIGSGSKLVEIAIEQH